MVDMFDKAKRSEIMRGIRSKDTQPEMLVRKKLHSLGFRFRLHDTKLPGKPDIVLPKHRAIIQVRGCFWHSHTCGAGRRPKSNREYWERKLDRNRNRDHKNDAMLIEMGWRVFVIWECEVSSEETLGHFAETIHLVSC